MKKYVLCIIIIFSFSANLALANPVSILMFGTPGSGNGQMSNIHYSAIDTLGNIYVGDYGNCRVQKFDSNGTYITQWGTCGSGNGQFNNNRGIVLDSLNNVYVSDSANARIQKFDSNGTYITQWGTAGSGNGQFSNNDDITTDSNNNIYVADYSNNRIQKFDSNGTYITQWGTFGTGNGQLSGPYGIGVDSNNNIYVAELVGHRIQKFDSNGVYISKFGINGSSDGELSFPTDVSVDSTGDIYVADYGNSRVQIFDSNGNFKYKFSVGSLQGEINSSIGLINSGTKLYVTENGNTRIQVFQDISPTILNSSSITNPNSVVSGACVTGLSVSLSVDGTPLAPVTCSGGSYTITLPSISNGVHTLSVTQSDTGLNTSSATTTIVTISSPQSGGGGGAVLIIPPVITSGTGTSNPLPTTGTGKTYISPLDNKEYSCTPFTKYLKLNSKTNDATEVKMWQAFLNKTQNETLPLSGIYDTKTFNAIKRFQSTYKSEVLTPWGISSPSGWTYKSTRAKGNQLLGCTEGKVKLDNGVTIELK